MLELFLYKGFNEIFYAHMTLYIVMNSVCIFCCDLHVVKCMLFAIENTKVMQFYHHNPMMGFMNHLGMFTWMLMSFFLLLCNISTFFLTPCFEQKLTDIWGMLSDEASANNCLSYYFWVFIQNKVTLSLSTLIYQVVVLS